MRAARKWNRVVTLGSAIALHGCGTAPSTDRPGSGDTASGKVDGGPNLIDAGTSSDGSQGSGDATDNGAALGCTGAQLDQNTWDSCPELAGTGPNCNCYGYAPEGGTLTYDDSVALFEVSSYLLPVPLTGGQPYAFSVTVSDNRFYGDIELWGTNATCGPGLEQLYAAPVATKTYCVNVVPSHSYPYVILVQSLAVDSGALASESASRFTACPTDHCP